MDPNRGPLSVPVVQSLGERVGSVELGLAIAPENQDALGADDPHQIFKQAQRRLIGPLKIIDKEQQATLPGQGEEKAGNAVKQPQPLFGGREFRDLGKRPDPTGQLGGEPGQLGARVSNDGVSETADDIVPG